MQSNSPLSLAGRVAVVTGGSRGIGNSIARSFAKSGMAVAIVSKSDSGTRSAAKNLRQQGLSAIGIPCDVSELESVHQALATVAEELGGIDVLVNSAGVLDLQSVSDTSVEHWDQVLAINLKGTFLACQQAIPYLEASSAARIINIASNAGRMGGFENGMAYTASKGGIISLTYGLARRLAAKGITVNCIAPGTIQSDMSSQWDAATQERLLLRFPIGRFGNPEEVAAAACYFASEEAGFTTGAVLDVNGGLFMG